MSSKQGVFLLHDYHNDIQNSLHQIYVSARHNHKYKMPFSTVTLPSCRWLEMFLDTIFTISLLMKLVL